jgi:acetyltransferase-like isoleucine patch superfamily enzyme
MTDPRHAIINDVTLGEGVEMYDQVNLYQCEIGSGTKIDAFVYIEEDVKIGSNCVIRPFTFIPTGIILGDYVFVGPQVTFTNDQYPSVEGEWRLLKTIVGDHTTIGAGATLAPGIEIGHNVTIGAGAVVLDDVPPETTVVGNPALPVNDE